ncbi:protein kinase [Planctomycetota bacterium]
MRVQLSITTGPMRGRVFSFDEPDRFLFGRAEKAQCALPQDPYVSRNHFLVEIAPPVVTLSDLNSKNGTFVNSLRYGGRKPLEPGARQAPDGAYGVALRDGDEIEVGDTRMKVTVAAAPATTGRGRTAPTGPWTEHASDAEAHTYPTCRETAAASERWDSRPSAALVAPKKAPLPRRDQGTLTRRPRPPARREETLTRMPGGGVLCARCGRDTTTAEAGVPGEQVGSGSICRRCRQDAASDPITYTQQLMTGKSMVEPDSGAPELADYRILSKLDEGGMGQVFKAYDPRSRRTVAVKTILPDVALDEGAITHFEREMRITRQLRHPHVVEFLDGGCAKGTFYLVLEFVEGMDLSQLLLSRGGRMSLREVAPLMVKALDGLGYAHTATVETEILDPQTRRPAIKRFRGVVHRDLKPPNILVAVASNGLLHPKISDLGLAKVYGAAGKTNFTQPGAVAGTPPYWPREQITEYRNLKPASDVFSMGAIMFKLLTGRLPRADFESLSTTSRFHEICDVIMTCPVDPIRACLPDLPKPLATVIDRSLEEEPADRYADAAEMRDALVDALNRTATLPPQ